MADDNKSAEKPAEKPTSATERRPSGAAAYDRVSRFLSDLQVEGGHTWPLDSDRIRTYIGDAAWVQIVNYERAEGGKEPMEPTDALSERPRLFDRKRIDRE